MMKLYKSNIASYNDIELVVLCNFYNNEIISAFTKLWGENQAYLVSKSEGLILASGDTDELKIYCDMHMIHFSQRFHKNKKHSRSNMI